MLGQYRCSTIDRINGTSQYCHRLFRFEHVQMAMKLHRSGKTTKAYLAQLADVDTMTLAPHNLYLFEARTVAHEFFARTQHWLFVPGSRSFQFPQVHLQNLPSHKYRRFPIFHLVRQQVHLCHFLQNRASQ